MGLEDIERKGCVSEIEASSGLKQRLEFFFRKANNNIDDYDSLNIMSIKTFKSFRVITMLFATTLEVTDSVAFSIFTTV